MKVKIVYTYVVWVDSVMVADQGGVDMDPDPTLEKKNRIRIVQQENPDPEPTLIFIFRIFKLLRGNIGGEFCMPGISYYCYL